MIMTNKEIIEDISKHGSDNVYDLNLDSFYAFFFVNKNSSLEDMFSSYGLSIDDVIDSNSEVVNEKLIMIRDYIKDSSEVVKNYLLETIFSGHGILDNEIRELELVKSNNEMRVKIVSIYTVVQDLLRDIYFELNKKN